MLASVSPVVVVGIRSWRSSGREMLGGTTPAAALPAPRFVEEARPPGSTTSYDGEFEFFVGGGVGGLRLRRRRALQTCISPAVSNPAALFRNESPIGGALRFTPLAGPGDGPGRRHRRLPARRGRRRGDATLPSCGVGENVLLRGLGDCRFERANEAWSFDGGDEWTTAFSATWEEGAAWPTLAFGNYVREDAIRRHPRQGDPHRSSVRTGPAATAPALDPRALLVRPLDALLRLGPHRPGQDLRVSNDRHYYSD